MIKFIYCLGVFDSPSVTMLVQRYGNENFQQIEIQSVCRVEKKTGNYGKPGKFVEITKTKKKSAYKFLKQFIRVCLLQI